MSTLVQWVHVTAAVIAVGGMGFILAILLPSARHLSSDQRELLLKQVLGRFRWVSWGAIVLLLVTGLYNMKEFYWDLRWGLAWTVLTIKIVLALMVFAISLSLTLPFKFLNKFRARRARWMLAAFALGIVVIYISAYLRRG